MNFVGNKRKFLRDILGISSGVFFIVTCLLFYFNKTVISSQIILSLLYVDIGLIALLCFFYFNRTKRIFRFSVRKNSSTRFHKQVVTLFSCATFLPAVCVFVFSILFFNVGIENLFKTPVKNMINNAEKIASIYIDDVKFSMKNFVNGVAEEISSCINGISINKHKINQILEEEVASLKVNVAVIQLLDNDNINIISSTPFLLSIQFETLPKKISYLNEGEITTWESDNLVFSAAMINSSLRICLIASTIIDPVVFDHKCKIKTAALEYTDLATKRSGIKFSFMMIFVATTVLLLLFSVFFGMTFTNWILQPVNKLITAAKNVASGDYSTLIKTKKSKNELDVLISTFNNMMEKLERQKQQLIISQRQNAWRDIARKIAHEIKNPLTPIQLSAERLQSKYQKEITTQPEIFNSCINTIKRQVTCIGNLVKEFSEFARMPSPKFEKIDIAKLLKDVVFMQSNIYKNISFHQNYDSDKLICEVDQNQINQVIMNLLQNSINAIVESKNGKSEEIAGNIMANLSTREDIICIDIEDDGPGFSDTAIAKALEPYYTTRSEGTGLGLAIVHKIVTDHSGEIVIGKSKQLKGASVSISIPCFQNKEVNEENYGI